MSQVHVNKMLNSLCGPTLNKAAKFKSDSKKFSFEVSTTYPAPKGKVTLLTRYGNKRVGTQHLPKAAITTEKNKWLSGKYDQTVAIMLLP